MSNSNQIVQDYISDLLTENNVSNNECELGIETPQEMVDRHTNED